MLRGRGGQRALRLENVSDQPVAIALNSAERPRVIDDRGNSLEAAEVSGVADFSRRYYAEDPSQYTVLSPGGVTTVVFVFEDRRAKIEGAVTTDARTRINLVFEPDTTEARLRELVSSVGGEVVAGPTALGVYTIATPVGMSGDPSVEMLLEQLRARSEIVFAELAAAARKDRG